MHVRIDEAGHNGLSVRVDNACARPGPAANFGIAAESSDAFADDSNGFRARVRRIYAETIENSSRHASNSMPLSV